VAEDLFDRGLCLPSGTAMTDGDLNRVIDTILNCRNKDQGTGQGGMGRPQISK